MSQNNVVVTRSFSLEREDWIYATLQDEKQAIMAVKDIARMLRAEKMEQRAKHPERISDVELDAEEAHENVEYFARRGYGALARLNKLANYVVFKASVPYGYNAFMAHTEEEKAAYTKFMKRVCNAFYDIVISGNEPEMALKANNLDEYDNK